MKCEICNSTEFRSIKSVGLSCTTCYPQSVSDVKKWVILHDSPITVCRSNTKGIGRAIQVTLRCTDCNHVFNETPANLNKIEKNNYHPCPICRKEERNRNLSKSVKHGYDTGKVKATRKYTPKQYASELKVKKIKPLEDFKGVSISILHECMVCSHQFKNSPANIFKSTKGCSRCSGKHLKTHDEYVQDLELSDSIFIPVEKYVNAKTQIKHECTVCGFLKLMSPTNALKVKGSEIYCPKHSELKGFKRKALKLGSREIVYQGYNDWAISLLLKSGIKPDEIVTEYEGIPKIIYRYKGVRRHFPDLYVPSKNLLIEVKSEYTLGLLNKSKSATLWYVQCAKYKGAIKQGYKYKLVLFTDKGERVALPDDWYTYSFKDALSKISTSSSS